MKDPLLPFAPEGYPFVLVPTVAGLLAWLFGYPAIAIAAWAIAVFCVGFFRNPPRHSDAPDSAILAPADGKVIAVTSAPPALVAAGLPQQISIFMSPLNVHVNRAPISGRVAEARWSPGAKLPAFRDKASDLNEHAFVRLEGKLGNVAYKQIAGSVARRVVCDLTNGGEVERGQRVGIIKFSSRVDLFLPAGARIEVGVNQRCRAGVTVVAHFPRP